MINDRRRITSSNSSFSVTIAATVALFYANMTSFDANAQLCNTYQSVVNCSYGLSTLCAGCVNGIAELDCSANATIYTGATGIYSYSTGPVGGGFASINDAGTQSICANIYQCSDNFFPSSTCNVNQGPVTVNTCSSRDFNDPNWCTTCVQGAQLAGNAGKIAYEDYTPVACPAS